MSREAYNLYNFSEKTESFIQFYCAALLGLAITGELNDTQTLVLGQKGK